MKILFLLLLMSVYLATSTVAAELPEGVTITETNLYVSTVDNLRIRETPELTGNVIGKVMRFEEVEYRGEKSTTQTSLEVDGDQISAPWIKVKTKQGVEGWIWGGFLSKINQLIYKPVQLEIKIPELFTIVTPYSELLLKLSIWIQIIDEKTYKNMNDSTRRVIDSNDNVVQENSSIKTINPYIDAKDILFPIYDTSIIEFQRCVLIKIRDSRVLLSVNGASRKIIADNWNNYTFYAMSHNDFEKLLLPVLDKNENDIFLKIFEKVDNTAEKVYKLKGIYDDEKHQEIIRVVFSKYKFTPRESISISYRLQNSTKDTSKTRQNAGEHFKVWEMGSEYIFKNIKVGGK